MELPFLLVYLLYIQFALYTFIFVFDNGIGWKIALIIIGLGWLISAISGLIENLKK